LAIDVLLLIYLVAHHVEGHAEGIKEFVNDFMKNKERVELSAGPKEGLLIKIVQREVQTGLTQQYSTQKESVPPNPNNLQQTAATAANRLVPGALQRAGTVVKVLWVDDHPESTSAFNTPFRHWEWLSSALIATPG
jgi:hypothetical protein